MLVVLTLSEKKNPQIKLLFLQENIHVINFNLSEK
jgi:hypothetical protein